MDLSTISDKFLQREGENIILKGYIAWGERALVLE